MDGLHVAFCLEQAYGHIIPTLGIAMELQRRGHRTSYAVARSFAPLVERIHARAAVINVLENRERILRATAKPNEGWEFFNVEREVFDRVAVHLCSERTASSLAQLEQLFRHDPPDLIIHDDCLDTAGRNLAQKWGIAKIRHHSQFLDWDSALCTLEEFESGDVVLVTVPAFFQRDIDRLGPRFHFVGFIPDGRAEVFDPWTSADASKPILISATSGLLPQLDFSNLMIETFRDGPWPTILAVPSSHDLVSAIDRQGLHALPHHMQMNTSASNFAILRQASLFIGQGGQGSTLEAIYHGVPQVVIPPTPYHNCVGRRVVELGLGECIPIHELTAATLIESVRRLFSSSEVAMRLRRASEDMHQHKGAEVAVDIIEEYLASNTHS